MMMMFITICDTIHARTELVFQESGGGGISPPPSVQFKLYQGEVLQYKPGASDHQNRTRHGFESTHSENPQAPTQSERGLVGFSLKDGSYWPGSYCSESYCRQPRQEVSSTQER